MVVVQTERNQSANSDLQPLSGSMPPVSWLKCRKRDEHVGVKQTIQGNNRRGRKTDGGTERAAEQGLVNKRTELTVFHISRDYPGTLIVLIHFGVGWDEWEMEVVFDSLMFLAVLLFDSFALSTNLGTHRQTMPV